MVPFTGLANIKLLSKSFTLDPKDYWAQVKSLSHQMAAIQLSELCSKNPLKFNLTQITLQVQLSRYYFTYLYTLSQQVLVLKKLRIRQMTMTYVLFSSNVNKLSRFFSSFFAFEVGGIKARPGSLSVLSVLRLGRGLKSIKEQPGSFFAIFRKFLGRVLFFDKTQPAM